MEEGVDEASERGETLEKQVQVHVFDSGLADRPLGARLSTREAAEDASLELGTSASTVATRACTARGPCGCGVCWDGNRTPKRGAGGYIFGGKPTLWLVHCQSSLQNYNPKSHS